MGAAKFFAANKMSETGVESENGIKINKCINITVWFINSSSLTDKTIWTNWLPVYGCHHKIHGWTITDFHFIISAPTNPQPPTYLKSYFFKVPFFKGTFFSCSLWEEMRAIFARNIVVLSQSGYCPNFRHFPWTVRAFSRELLRFPKCQLKSLYTFLCYPWKIVTLVKACYS